jgi:HEAT repeat protein
VPEVQKLLDSSEWFIRRNGVFILGEMKTSVVIDRIGSLINDDEEQVQLAVIDSLMKTGRENIKSYLLKGLQSKYNKVVIAAMKQLEKEDVLDKLVQVAGWLKSRKGIPDIKEEQFRQEIIEVLGRFGDDSVLEPLVAILNERPIFKADLLHPTKRAVLNSLAKIGSEKTMEVLREVTNHKDQFVATAAEEILSRLNK